ncbi:MAG: 5-dehydro-2-deoxygluconokinase [Rhabdaerophilum sp.]
MKDLDLICIGRVSVDLYGQQIGGRLEDMASFAKSVGGCPANIAIGTARLGLKSALVSRVGDEAMGRFVREQLGRERVNVEGLKTDPSRLTALALLGMRDEQQCPRVSYRTESADDAMDEGDIDKALISRARAVLVTGSYFAKPASDAAQRKAMRLAQENGAKIILDIDYSPAGWALAGQADDAFAKALLTILPECDLIAGTEEDLQRAGGVSDTLEALRAIRKLAPRALIIAKRGAQGCLAFPKAIPGSMEQGVQGPSFSVEVYNALGASDALLAGFLSSWLRDEPLETCCQYANACAAIAVSRLMCSPEFPSAAELRHVLDHGTRHRALRHDPVLNHIHHAATRRPVPGKLAILSIDHGPHDLEPMVKRYGGDPARIPHFKTLAVRAAAGAAAARVAKPGEGVGMFLDGGLGREALFRAEDHDFWVARQVPHGERIRLTEWPARQVAKLIANGRSDARTPLNKHLPEVKQVFAAAQALGREVLIEALPPEGETTADILEKLYSEGLQPDFWLIELQHDAASWAAVDAVITAHDPLCRGAIVIARNAQSGPDLAKAGKQARVAGFVGGRSVFGAAFQLWLSDGIDDDAAVAMMKRQFEALADAFMS